MRIYTTMPKKKAKAPKQFYTEAQLAKDPTLSTDAPVVGGEFIDIREEGTYTGQTVEVKSDTHLEQDTGYGEEVILRTYEFGANPLAFKDHTPTAQEIFNSHMKGIMSLLWQDGLQPAEEIQPRLILSKDNKKYLIMVGARAMRGQFFMEKPRTLTEILKPSESSTNKNKV
jgi:hypothetical protein